MEEERGGEEEEEEGKVLHRSRRGGLGGCIWRSFWLLECSIGERAVMLLEEKRGGGRGKMNQTRRKDKRGSSTITTF